MVGGDGGDFHSAVILRSDDERVDVALEQRPGRLVEKLRSIGGVDDHREVPGFPRHALNALEHAARKRHTGDLIGEDADCVGPLRLQTPRELIGDVPHVLRRVADPLGGLHVHTAGVAVIKDQ